MDTATAPIESSYIERIEAAGLSEYLPILKGGHAIHLNRLHRLRRLASDSGSALDDELVSLGISDPTDREKVAALLQEFVRDRKPLQPSKELREPAGSDAESWAHGVAGADSELEQAVQGVDATAFDEAHEAEGIVDRAGEQWPPGMQIVNDNLALSIREQGMIKEPNTLGYIQIAAEVETPRPLHKTSEAKKKLLQDLKEAAADLSAEAGVRRVDVFSAIVIPPGSKEGRELLERSHAGVHVAEFDVAILIECTDIEAAKRARETETFAKLMELLDAGARTIHCITAKNAKRIDEVDKTKDGVFLFNYFYVLPPESGAAPVDIMLGVWEYTAGWWTAKANLDNSTPLQALPESESEYTLINHCRWDKAIDVLPSLLFRPTLDKFVLKNFTVNGIVAMPVLYHLA